MDITKKILKDNNRNEILTNFIAGKSVSVISKNLDFEIKDVESVIRNFLIAKLNMERV